MKEVKEPQKPIEVTLLKNHTHADRDYVVGDKIKVTEPERNWLAQQGIIAAPLKAVSDPRPQT